jgi:HAD superfamily phosphoserine phosphatase-like hydrolase
MPGRFPGSFPRLRPPPARRCSAVPTVVFDFDSTLVACESLEEVLSARLDGRPDLVEKVREITELGMAGKISFDESLGRRLAIVPPRRQDIRRFGKAAHCRLTPGIAELVAELHARRVGVSIVSGTTRELMLPVAKRLKIPARRVHGVRPRWGKDGRFLGLRPDDAFVKSKALGVAEISKRWSRPRIAVGDGATDLALLRAGAVDRFVAFTEHARRKALLVPGVPEARNVAELRRILEELL